VEVRYLLKNIVAFLFMNLNRDGTSLVERGDIRNAISRPKKSGHVMNSKEHIGVGELLQNSTEKFCAIVVPISTQSAKGTQFNSLR
jgi:hypothetical protein